MQTKKPEIKARICEAALDEFYEQDYRSATMRNIAKRAGIPTGLTYTYYKNKEELFDEVLRPALHYIYSKFDETGSLLGKEKKEAESDFLEKVLQWPREIVILTEKSSGSKYHGFTEKLRNDLAKHINADMSKRYDDYDEMYSKILATCYTASIFRISKEYKSKEWADKMVKYVNSLLFFREIQD